MCFQEEPSSSWYWNTVILWNSGRFSSISTTDLFSSYTSKLQRSKSIAPGLKIYCILTLPVFLLWRRLSEPLKIIRNLTGLSEMTNSQEIDLLRPNSRTHKACPISPFRKLSPDCRTQAAFGISIASNQMLMQLSIHTFSICPEP